MFSTHQANIYIYICVAGVRFFQPRVVREMAALSCFKLAAHVALAVLTGKPSGNAARAWVVVLGNPKYMPARSCFFELVPGWYLNCVLHKGDEPYKFICFELVFFSVLYSQ